MEIAILLALILLNGLFAMSEIALVTARKARLQRYIDEGDRGAMAAVKLGEDPTRFLSTVQIGITSIGVLNGVVGESTLATPLAIWLQGVAGLPATTAGYAATAIVVAGLTYFSIVLGELVPKRLGQMAPEAIARLAARPISFLSVASKPFVKLLSGSTQLVLRLLGVKTDRGPAVTEEEIHALLVEGSEAGVIERHEHTMVRNVFRLDDRQLASLMVPRGDVVYLDVEATEEENIRRIEESDHSRFPVVRGGMHDILGVVSARQLLARRLRGEKADLTAVLQAAVFVPESVTGMELLENFRSSGGQIAFVIDEYGEVLGLVTLQDLIEAITGEFKTETAGEEWAVQRDDGSWLLDGLIPIPELKDRIGLRSVPEEDKERYHTLSGMLLLLLGRLPQTADSVQWADWKFEIIDMDGKRIDKVLASRIPPEDGPEPETTG
ncbi:MAG: HlyC/CorC family transporter [Cupriavidus sp.]|jgi:putative hemolysin|uniref:hemolysin family protein n=1 Tax=Cupriavidus pauculus TaxID=82633 RepID=UPI00078071AA|nr:hemolysin family protein [Cupriavidus pauculus]MBU67966.1 HlyC/CorC family transporter [Cupriavidus sp.]KAB0602726.1 HlyC/CorC family transporter [Cupriavidus pauculus]MBY4734172.1 hemolysin family protein [Cupriavidus pauculus]MCM3606223.1 hemolysin family protein [Cupriavidus pauculus]UAL02830.1 hemolysin family protein [Cupriavidus pauculus]